MYIKPKAKANYKLIDIKNNQKIQAIAQTSQNIKIKK